MARGLGWILATNVALSVDYSMLMPTGWEYIDQLGGSQLFYGGTIAAFPVGRIALVLLMGHWSDKSGFRRPFLLANILSILGGLLYGSASALGSKWCAMLGRLIAGCGATHPLSAWAARIYPAEKRVEIESLQKATSLVGVILGPALNAFVVGLRYEWGPIQINPQTCAGYVPALVSTILLVGFLVGVDEPPVRNRESSDLSPAGKEIRPWNRVISTGAWLLMLIAFQSNLQIACIDTVLAPLASQHFGWDLLANSFMFAVLALVSFLGAVTGAVAGRYGVRAPRVVLLGQTLNVLLAVVISCLFWRGPDNLSMGPVLVASTLCLGSILFYSGAVGGLFQQSCGNAQGLLGGCFVVAFALGRPIGSLVGGFLLQGNPLPLCLIVPGGVLITCLLQTLLQRRLEITEDKALLGSFADRPTDVPVSEESPGSMRRGGSPSGVECGEALAA